MQMNTLRILYEIMVFLSAESFIFPFTVTKMELFGLICVKRTTTISAVVQAWDTI